MIKFIKNLFKKDTRLKCPLCKRVIDGRLVKPILGAIQGLQFPIVACTGCTK